MSDAVSITPARIGQKGDRALEIVWADGAVSEFEVRALRLACACAPCIDEWSGKGTLDPATVPEGFEISARTPDGVIMGLRQRELRLEGVQFHPESILTVEGKNLLANFLATAGERAGA